MEGFERVADSLKQMDTSSQTDEGHTSEGIRNSRDEHVEGALADQHHPHLSTPVLDSSVLLAFAELFLSVMPLPDAGSEHVTAYLRHVIHAEIEALDAQLHKETVMIMGRSCYIKLASEYQFEQAAADKEIVVLYSNHRQSSHSSSIADLDMFRPFQARIQYVLIPSPHATFCFHTDAATSFALDNSQRSAASSTFPSAAAASSLIYAAGYTLVDKQQKHYLTSTTHGETTPGSHDAYRVLRLSGNSHQPGGELSGCRLVLDKSNAVYDIGIIEDKNYEFSFAEEHNKEDWEPQSRLFEHKWQPDVCYHQYLKENQRAFILAPDGVLTGTIDVWISCVNMEYSRTQVEQAVSIEVADHIGIILDAGVCAKPGDSGSPVFVQRDSRYLCIGEHRGSIGGRLCLCTPMNAQARGIRDNDFRLYNNGLWICSCTEQRAKLLLRAMETHEHKEAELVPTTAVVNASNNVSGILALIAHDLMKRQQDVVDHLIACPTCHCEWIPVSTLLSKLASNPNDSVRLGCGHVCSLSSLVTATNWATALENVKPVQQSSRPNVYKEATEVNERLNQLPGRWVETSQSNCAPASAALPSTPAAPPSRSGYVIGIVTALAIERLAVELCLDDRWNPEYPSIPEDVNVYTYGRMGNHPLVIISLAGVYGQTAASEVTAHLLRSHPNIRDVLMVGIAGGVPHPGKHDIRLGDVVISAGPVWQYDFGKLTSVGTIETTGHLSPPSRRFQQLLGSLMTHDPMDKGVIRNPLKQLSQTALLKLVDEEMVKQFSRPHADTDVLYSGNEETSPPVIRTSRSDPAQPHVHYGIIATANVVLKDSITRDQLRDSTQHGDVLCVEMEAAGVAHVASGHAGYLVIRGICDYADSHKHKLWQKHAAVVAAATAKILLQNLSKST